MGEERITNGSKETSERIVIIDTENLSNITKGSSTPVEPFTSPFLGKTVEEVSSWFDSNITQPERTGYMHNCFLILDAQSVDDETCIFVCTRDAPLQSLRCDFYLAAQNAVICEMGQNMKEGIMGSFMRSGEVMTKENLKLVESGGLYIEDGEVKLDESWRNFLQW